MAVTFSAPVVAGDGLWLVSWTSTETAPTYRVYLDGVLVSTQTAAQFLVSAQANAMPVLEVLDHTADAPSEAHPATLTLGWLTNSDVADYRVEQKVSGSWTEIVTLAREDGPWQQYTTPVLADDTTHEWRIVPIDAAGNEGTEHNFTALLVRHPDVPSVSYAYSAVTGLVTITAA
jgi:hypothetical protein